MSSTPYLELEPSTERQIAKNREQHVMSPFAFKDEDITRREENPHDYGTIGRPAFRRDVDKILNIPAYNRYADKTQVFSLIENDDICRRGLHVQLVSNIARNIGSLLGLNTDLIEAIALGHDLGHTPFGHAGERFLNECLHQRTGRYFNHNVQSVRVMDELYRRNISLQTLDGALCHNGEFAQQELTRGTTASFDQLDQLVEACANEESTIATLRPSTLEGCVVRVSDMIAYLGKDRQDALTIGAIDSLDVFESEYIGVDNARIINNLTVDIVNNSLGHEKLAMSEKAFVDIVNAKKQNYELIYLKEGMVADDKNIVAAMFEEVYERCIDDLARGDESSPIYRHHIDKLAERSNSITREAYLQENPDQVVVDFISSMTDSYFLSLHAHMFPQATSTLHMKRYGWRW